MTNDDQWNTLSEFDRTSSFIEKPPGAFPAGRVTITIDGPAGAGKSTVARLLAERLGLVYLDTGAIYRTIAYMAIKSGLSLDDEALMAEICRKTRLKIFTKQSYMHIDVDGEVMSEQIRSEKVSLAASKISAYPSVRKALLPYQQEIALQGGGLVAEGRDMGSVVFPDADYKFYLDADPSERASRRYQELSRHSKEVNLAELQKDVHHRDRNDRERAVAPLMSPEGAVVVDSTSMTVEQVVEVMVRIITGKVPGKT